MSKYVEVAVLFNNTVNCRGYIAWVIDKWCLWKEQWWNDTGIE
jgi:hypothetical protein